MRTPLTESPLFLSSRAYALIASSARLKKKLLPGGLFATPYEILDYQATLTLHDLEGITATFRRTQRIRFLQDGVSGILDHLWGDGVVLTNYDNTAGSLEDSFRDEGHHHLVIGLKKPMHRGQTLTFSVTRTAMVGFTRGEEWLETTLDHPAKWVKCNIVFPYERPCRQASFFYEGYTVALPVRTVANGKTQVTFELPEPRAYAPSLVRWSW